MKTFWHLTILVVIIATISWGVVDVTYHEWHPIGPNVKFGTLLNDENASLCLNNELDWTDCIDTEKREKPEPYVKKTFTWNSNKIDEDTITWQFFEGATETTLFISATDYGPDANAWVRFDWCSRHGEVRAVRVE